MPSRTPQEEVAEVLKCLDETTVAMIHERGFIGEFEVAYRQLADRLRAISWSFPPALDTEAAGAVRALRELVRLRDSPDYDASETVAAWLAARRVLAGGPEEPSLAPLNEEAALEESRRHEASLRRQLIPLMDMLAEHFAPGDDRRGADTLRRLLTELAALRSRREAGGVDVPTLREEVRLLWITRKRVLDERGFYWNAAEWAAFLAGLADRLTAALRGAGEGEKVAAQDAALDVEEREDVTGILRMFLNLAADSSGRDLRESWAADANSMHWCLGEARAFVDRLNRLTTENAALRGASTETVHVGTTRVFATADGSLSFDVTASPALRGASCPGCGVVGLHAPDCTEGEHQRSEEMETAAALRSSEQAGAESLEALLEKAFANGLATGADAELDRLSSRLRRVEEVRREMDGYGARGEYLAGLGDIRIRPSLLREWAARLADPAPDSHDSAPKEEASARAARREEAQQVVRSGYADARDPRLSRYVETGELPTPEPAATEAEGGEPLVGSDGLRDLIRRLAREEIRRYDRAEKEGGE